MTRVQIVTKCSLSSVAERVPLNHLVRGSIPLGSTRRIQMPTEESIKPNGEITIQVLAMPADTNPDGDIFGGWLLSQMDIGGALLAKREAQTRVVTVAIEKMKFVQPVFVGDTLKIYSKIEKIGNTSITINVEAWAERDRIGKLVKVTEGLFSYVAFDKHRNPIPVKRQ